MRFALLLIWNERRRYLAGVVAVAVSNVLIAFQFGLMIGLFSLVSLPVDRSGADVWVTSPNAPSCDLGFPISNHWSNQLRMQPGVVATDDLILFHSFWKSATQGNVLIVLVGFNINDNSLGPTGMLTPEQRVSLTEVGSVILDRKESRRLGVTRVGEMGEVVGRPVRVVGFCEDLGNITGPYVLCSQETARSLLIYLGFGAETTTFVLGRCANPEDARRVVAGLRGEKDISAFTAEEFSWNTRVHWLMTTKAGVGVSFVALFGLVVGLVITSQTLASATLSMTRELALLRALGTPRWRMRLFLFQQSFVVGVFGLLVGVPTTYGLNVLAQMAGTKVTLPPELVVFSSSVTLLMAVLSGLLALNTLRRTEPEQLLR
jgi:putative ABC transport system permease protein